MGVSGDGTSPTPIIEAYPLRRLRILCFLVNILALGISAQTVPSKPSVVSEPKTAIEWFQRANNQMNLRLPGSAPFHMKVVFHAYPGNELLKPKEPSHMITGEGVYEETWLAPHQWRREVTLADYHATEVESQSGRRFQASSDYEPSRVLMLLEALLYPIPPGFLTSQSIYEGADRSDLRFRSSIEHLSNGRLSLVRINESLLSQETTESSAYFFLPHGVLVSAVETGIETDWQDDFLFAGKVVSRHITLKTADRTLLTSEIAVEPTAQTSSEYFHLPLDPAAPGTTMRPLRYLTNYMVVPAPLKGRDAYPYWPPPRENSGLELRGVIDRDGAYRELEVTLDIGGISAGFPIGELRKLRFHPFKIDGSVGELGTYYGAFTVRGHSEGANQ